VHRLFVAINQSTFPLSGFFFFSVVEILLIACSTPITSCINAEQNHRDYLCLIESNGGVESGGAVIDTRSGDSGESTVAPIFR
jgi:hypothetical protein